MNANTAADTADHFSASLTVEGAHVHISAPTFDLLAALLNKFRAGNALPPAGASTVEVAKTRAPKPSAGVSADEKQAAAEAGNVSPSQSQPAASPSVAPAAEQSAATSPAAASAVPADFTLDKLSKATIACVQKKGADFTSGLITPYGVKKASELFAKDQVQAFELFGKLTAALEG